MTNRSGESRKYMSSVKVGPKGQIVLPKEVRDMFEIKPGDTLILLADSEKGIAIQQSTTLYKIVDAILDGRAKEILPEYDEESSKIFAREFREMIAREEKNPTRRKKRGGDEEGKK